MHRFIKNYWRQWFPHVPGYQTFVLRHNQLEPPVHTCGRILSKCLATTHTPELDHIVDSVPVMLAQHGHSYAAKVAQLPAPLSVIARRKRRAFTAFASTSLRNEEADAYPRLRRSGCVKARITTRKPSSDNRHSCPPLHCLATWHIRHRKLSITYKHNAHGSSRHRKNRKAEH